ncbi:MAG TPA: hypothetical protein PK074_06775 [Spirochaetales bacterium]|nr:hypothetical protein [Spirochaetales bacterium]HQK34414.1 hypothetical protein [Spirochaetales bacterium]
MKTHATILCKQFTPQGIISVPPSKSIAQRALILASFSETPSQVEHIGSSADVNACIDVLTNLGATIRHIDPTSKPRSQNDTDNHNAKDPYRSVTIKPIELQKFSTPLTIQAQESATLARMLSCIVPGLFTKLNIARESCSAVITGTGTLLKRPMNKTAMFLETLGLDVSLREHKWLPMKLQGNFRPGSHHINELDSSQPVSGAIIGLSLLDSDSKIYIREQPSIPYSLLTAHLANLFGAQITYDIQNAMWHIKGVQSLHGITYRVESDWSAASLWLAAAALHGSITIKNINLASHQPDRQILELLDSYGADITITSANSNESAQSSLRNSNNCTLSLTANNRRAFTFDCRDTPDLFPSACLLAAGCTETSTIHGLKNITGKESNRVETLITILKKLGASCSLSDSTLKIKGISHFKNAELVLPPDHRMCMFALLAACNLAADASLHLTIANGGSFEEVIAKSYPDFLNHYMLVGGLLS